LAKRCFSPPTSGYWAPIAHPLGADHEIKLRNTEDTLYAWLLVKFCDPARNFVDVVELLKKDLSVSGEIEPYSFGEIIGQGDGPVQKWVVRRAVDNIVLGRGIPGRAEVIRRMHADFTPSFLSMRPSNTIESVPRDLRWTLPTAPIERPDGRSPGFLASRSIREHLARIYAPST
jgi:hypothetical protein